jgi:hypothetical protein
MRVELTKQLFAHVAGLALVIGAVACGGTPDNDPTQSVDNGGQTASASPQERVDGFQIFPHNPSLFPPITLPPLPDGGVALPPFTFPPPPDGGVALPPFTFPPPPDGGLFVFPPITLPGLPPITLPGLPPDGGITLPPLPSFPGH